jgi:murein DD-endopeptidase MepM/ murein hydrolase activator NlpD
MKENSNNKRKLWWEKLKNVYRLQLVEEKTYDVKFVLELNRLNVITLIGILIALFTIVNFFFIAYTPLKQYIPGYGAANSRKDLVELKLKTEKLEEQILANEKYNNNLKNILKDKIKIAKLQDDIQKVEVDTNVLTNLGRNEAKFISDIEKGLKNAALYDNLRYKKQNNVLKTLKIHQVYKQAITQKFNAKTNIGMSYLAKNEEPCYAALDGKIISIEIQPNNTYNIIIQHNNDLISKYKNINKLKYKTTNFVQEGSVIGNADDKNNVQFELWYKGVPINPEKYF